MSTKIMTSLFFNPPALLDTIIRLTTIIARGVFVFAAVKYLGKLDFGLYVTISAIISLLQYVVAGDYSYIAHREFLAGRIKFIEILNTQIILLVALFFAVCPVLFSLLPPFIEAPVVAIVFLILFLESITSELQRHLVAISKFTRANLMLFFKSAGWMTPVLYLLYLDKELRSINTLVAAWALGLAASLIVGIKGVFDHIKPMEAPNKGLLKKYFKTVPVVLAGTLATRSLFSLDRIILEKFNGLEIAGVYGLYVGMAAAFVAILDAGVLSRSYPKLVTLTSENSKEFSALSKRVQAQVSSITFIAIIVYELAINTFLRTISKSAYAEYTPVGGLLIMAYGIYSLSFPLNCKLYASNKDKTITLINAFSLFPLAIILFLNSISPYGVALAVTGCAGLHYILRYLINYAKLV